MHSTKSSGIQIKETPSLKLNKNKDDDSIGKSNENVIWQ